MLGERVRLLIKKSGFTQKEAADAAGMSEQNLKKHFKKGTITAMHLKRIADFIGVTIDAFFEEGDVTISNESKMKYMDKNKGNVNQTLNVGGGDSECRKQLEETEKKLSDTQAKLEKMKDKYIKLLEGGG
jgi:transcriptional regulator with XRE-family HTH domain